MIGDLGSSPGLDWFKLYEADVVDVDDPLKMCRIKARIKLLMDEIPDEFLPWCLPFYGYSNGQSKESGTVSIPPKGAKVILAFQDGSIHHPIYMGYIVDNNTQLEEMLHNYPDRNVMLWPNKCLLIVDTKSNEVMFRNMGNLHLYVTGDVDLTVNGNMTERVFGNRTLYVEGNNTEIIKGNSTRQVTDETVVVKGSRRTYVAKSSLEQVAESSTHVVGGDNLELYGARSARYVQGSDQLISNGKQFLSAPSDGSTMDAQMPEVPEIPPITPPDDKVPPVGEWPGVRYEQPRDKNQS